MSWNKKRRLGWWSMYVAGGVGVSLVALRANEPKSLPPSAAAVADHDDGAVMARVASQMAFAATNWISSLSEEQKAAANFAFDNENRFDWHFIPRQRKGLAYKDMNSAQRALAVALLNTGLSNRGMLEAETIMSLDEILKSMEPGPPKTPYRDPENYSFSIFGSPGEKTTWGWRVEGHHLSINFTIVDGKAVAGGPVFLGTNPAEVREGPRKGLRLLATEDDAGHELVRSLSDEQKKKAIIAAEAPKEIITGNSRKANPGAPVGIAFAEMTDAQKQATQRLVAHYAFRLRHEMAEADLAAIQSGGWDKVYFAWAGGLDEGQGHYYRIHGPTFLVEFDDTQNNANHVHTVWRDAANDFGEDLLKRHYQEQDHGGK